MGKLSLLTGIFVLVPYQASSDLEIVSGGRFGATRNEKGPKRGAYYDRRSLTIFIGPVALS